jgi:hypothetical protein
MRSIRGIFLIGLAALVGSCGRMDSSQATANVRSPSPDAPPASVSGNPSSGIDWATLARPLRLPELAAGGTCPRSSGRQVSPAFGVAFGDGPVYPVLGSTESLIEPLAFDGRYRAKVLWVSSSSYQGPVLIRGARLDGAGVVEFTTESGSTSELRLLRATATSEGEEAGWREWPSYTDVPGSGCYAYQVDGTTFGSIVIVFSARVEG